MMLSITVLAWMAPCNISSIIIIVCIIRWGHWSIPRKSESISPTFSLGNYEKLSVDKAGISSARIIVSRRRAER